MIEDKLRDLGITLPLAPKPLAIYIPAVRSRSLLFISGQLPLVDGKLVETGNWAVSLRPSVDSLQLELQR